MSALIQHTFSPQDYLEWEANQDFKNEYFAGDVFAQAGTLSTHGTLTLNLGAILNMHLKGKSCRAYIADMKLRVSEVDVFFYRDVTALQILLLKYLHHQPTGMI